MGNYTQLLDFTGPMADCVISVADCANALESLSLGPMKTLEDFTYACDGAKFVGYVDSDEFKALRKIAKHTTSPTPTKVTMTFKDEEFLFMRLDWTLTPTGGRVDVGVYELQVKDLPFQYIPFTEEDSE